MDMLGDESDELNLIIVRDFYMCASVFNAHLHTLYIPNNKYTAVYIYIRMITSD